MPNPSNPDNSTSPAPGSQADSRRAPTGPPLQVLSVESDEPRGALAADPPLHPTDAFLEELERDSQQLESATPQEILRWTVDRFAPRFTMATAFGPEGMTIIHMLAEIAPETPVFNLETGYQFAETLELREQVKRKYGIEVEYKYPDTTVEEYEATHGGPLYKTNPNQCCFDRKLRVLHEAAKGQHAWASAIRRDQSPDRAKSPIVGWDRKFQLVKVSPLANWTNGLHRWQQQRVSSMRVPHEPILPGRNCTIPIERNLLPQYVRTFQARPCLRRHRVATCLACSAKTIAW